MPNIILIGFRGHQVTKIRDQIEELLMETGDGDDSVTTVINADVRDCRAKEPAPYIIVRSTGLFGWDAKRIARLLGESLGVDAEWEKVGFFPKI